MPNVRVVRILIYEGPAEKMETQLGQSMHDGVREFGDMSIRVATVPESVVRAYEHLLRDVD